MKKYHELVTGLIDRKSDLHMNEDLKFRWARGIYLQPKPGSTIKTTVNRKTHATRKDTLRDKEAVNDNVK